MPPLVICELAMRQNFGHHCSVFLGKRGPQHHDHANKIKAHDMGKEKNDAIRINEVGHTAKDLLKSWW
jgi:hypothetical protein